jgi:hypothetical protein
MSILSFREGTLGKLHSLLSSGRAGAVIWCCPKSPGRVPLTIVLAYSALDVLGKNI